jgi:hypothetical protein
LTRRTLTTLLALAAAAHAGLVYDALCEGCGFTCEGLEHGTGSDPLVSCAVYLAPEWGRPVTVAFDLAPAFWAFTGVAEPPPRLSDDYWALFDAHTAEFGELMADWSPPQELDSGDLPPGAAVWGAGEGRATLVLVPEVYDEEARFTCPRCGEPTLEFHRIGFWD